MKIPAILSARAVVLLLSACGGSAAVDAPGEATGAVDNAPPSIYGFTGDWRLRDKPVPGADRPEQLRVIVQAGTADGTGTGFGVGLRVVERPTLPYLDRVDFDNVGGAETSEAIDADEHQILYQSQRTVWRGRALVHVLGTSVSRAGITTQSSSAEQVLWIENDALHYRYTLDGEVEEELVFAHANAAP